MNAPSAAPSATRLYAVRRLPLLAVLTCFCAAPAAPNKGATTALAVNAHEATDVPVLRTVFPVDGLLA